MDIFAYEDLAEAIPVEGLVVRELETMLFPVMVQVARKPGDLRPQFATQGEHVRVRAVAEIRGRQFCVRWSSAGMEDMTGGFQMKDERVARRLFPELSEHTFQTTAV